MTSNTIYYVYAYIRLNGTPYYVGKGKGKRAYSKQHSVWVPNKDSGQIVILEKNLTEIGALAIERRLIRWWGKKHEGGLLYNKADGGEGVTGYNIGHSCSEETKKKLSKIKMGKSYPKLTEANRKTGEKRKGTTLSKETKEKLKVSRSKWSFSEEHKKNLSITQIGKKHPVKSVTCPICEKTGNPGGMARYHFDNCKFKT
jgi:hypothetical protein